MVDFFLSQESHWKDNIALTKDSIFPKIVFLIVLVILTLIFLKKKNDGDVYNKSDHEGFKTDIIGDIRTKIDQVNTDLTTTLTNISTSAGTNKGILETKSDQILKAHRNLSQILLYFHPLSNFPHYLL